jgi:hypothetical protein
MAVLTTATSINVNLPTFSPGAPAQPDGTGALVVTPISTNLGYLVEMRCITNGLNTGQQGDLNQMRADELYNFVNQQGVI